MSVGSPLVEMMLNVDDIPSGHDETEYLWKCADNVWRDQSARITYAVQHIEMKESNEELPIGEWLNFTYPRKPS